MAEIETRENPEIIPFIPPSNKYTTYIDGKPMGQGDTKDEARLAAKIEYERSSRLHEDNSARSDDNNRDYDYGEKPTSTSDLPWSSHPAVMLVGSGLCFGLGYLLVTYTHKFSLAWWIGIIASLAGIPAAIAFMVAAFASLTAMLVVCIVVAIVIALFEYFSKHLY